MLIDEISRQSIGYNVTVRICVDNGEKSTGNKRNELLKAATSDYVWFIDADDMIMPGAIPAIFEGLKKTPDCLAINGIMTTNGKNLKQWFISKNNQYRSDLRNGKEVYLRWTNHITPIKREIAQQFEFPDKYDREDYDWSVLLRKSGLLKKEVKITVPVYHYQYKTNK